MAEQQAPQHADYWKLADVIQMLGQATMVENTVARFEALLGDVADPDTLSFVSLQRALRTLSLDSSTPSELLTTMAALWVDGFMTGAHFERRRLP